MWLEVLDTVTAVAPLARRGATEAKNTAVIPQKRSMMKWNFHETFQAPLILYAQIYDGTGGPSGTLLQKFMATAAVM